jgi:hypothetical protein
VAGFGFYSYMVNHDSTASGLEGVVKISNKDRKNAQHILDFKKTEQSKG